MFRSLLFVPLMTLLLLAGCGQQPLSRIEIAQQHFDADELEATVALSNELIAAGEEEYEARLLLGRVNLEEGEYEAAIDELTMAIEVEPNQPRAYYYRSQAYFALEDYIKGKTDRDLSISLQPDGATTLENLDSTFDTLRGETLVDIDEDTEGEDPVDDETEVDVDVETPDEEMQVYSGDVDVDAVDSQLAAERERLREELEAAPVESSDRPRSGVVGETPAGDSYESPLDRAPLAIPPVSGVDQVPSGSAGEGAEQPAQPRAGDTPLPLLEDDSTSIERDPGYQWNDYLDPPSEGSGRALPGTGLSTLPPTGLIPHTGLTPPSGLTPQAGLGGVAGSQSGLPVITPQGGVTTGIISGPSSLPGQTPYPVTGPLGAARGAAAGGGTPGVLPPGGTVPAYGPRAQSPQAPVPNTGNYILPSAAQPGAGSPLDPPRSTPTAPTTGIRSGTQP